MTEVTPISAASLGTTVVAAMPASTAAPTLAVYSIPQPSTMSSSAVNAVSVTTGAFTLNAPESLPLDSDPSASAFRRSETPQEKHPILKHFEFGHLPLHLAAVSAEFHALAHKMAELLPNGPEKSAGLRKLLESKDCAVRAAKP